MKLEIFGVTKKFFLNTIFTFQIMARKSQEKFKKTSLIACLDPQFSKKNRRFTKLARVEINLMLKSDYQKFFQ